MLNEWFEKHYTLLKAVLLILAAVNGWIGYRNFADHPIAGSANCAMAVLIVLGVLFSWNKDTPE